MAPFEWTVVELRRKTRWDRCKRLHLHRRSDLTRSEPTRLSCDLPGIKQTLSSINSKSQIWAWTKAPLTTKNNNNTDNSNNNNNNNNGNCNPNKLASDLAGARCKLSDKGLGGLIFLRVCVCVCCSRPIAGKLVCRLREMPVQIRIQIQFGAAAHSHTSNKWYKLVVLCLWLNKVPASEWQRDSKQLAASNGVCNMS